MSPSSASWLRKPPDRLSKREWNLNLVTLLFVSPVISPKVYADYNLFSPRMFKHPNEHKHSNAMIIFSALDLALTLNFTLIQKPPRIFIATNLFRFSTSASICSAFFPRTRSPGSPASRCSPWTVTRCPASPRPPLPTSTPACAAWASEAGSWPATAGSAGSPPGSGPWTSRWPRERGTLSSAATPRSSGTEASISWAKTVRDHDI